MYRNIASDSWTAKEAELLNSAVEKLVKLGERSGITPDDMIELLDSGYSIGELVMFLVSKRSGLPS